MKVSFFHPAKRDACLHARDLSRETRTKRNETRGRKMAEHVSRRCKIVFVNTNPNITQLGGNNIVAFRKISIANLYNIIDS